MARPSLAATRREQILDALERCLAQRGLEGTSLESVAAEAGVARPVRERLFRALFAGIDDAALLSLLHGTHQGFEDACFAGLRAEAPAAPTAAVRGAAYAITCLAEQNAGFIALGFPRSRAPVARAAAAPIARHLKENGHVRALHERLVAPRFSRRHRSRPGGSGLGCRA